MSFLQPEVPDATGATQSRGKPSVYEAMETLEKSGSEFDVRTLSSGTASKKMASIKLKTEAELRNLKSQFEADKEELENKMEEIDLELTKPRLTDKKKEDLDYQRQVIMMKRKQLLKKFDREFAAAMEKGKLEEKVLQVEEDDEQELGSEDEAVARNYKYDDGKNRQLHHHNEPVFDKDVNDETKNEEGKIRQPFPHSQQHEIRQPLEVDQRPPQTWKPNEHDVSCHSYNSNSFDMDMGQPGKVDKDALLIQLMQSQMRIMEKGQMSAGEKYLPEFNGDPAHWGNFKAAYDRVRKKHNPDNSELMMRLQKVIKGNARQVVEHLMANVNNVDKIVETLEFRFGRPEYVIDYLIEKVKMCNRPDPAKPESIVEFGTNVDALVSNIHAFDQKDYLCSKQLVTELVEKLPGQMKDDWYNWIEEHYTRKQNLSEFSEWMKKRVKIAMYRIKPVVNATPSSSEGLKQRFRRGPGSSHAIAGDEEYEEKLVSMQCSGCKKKNHPLEKCWVFLKMNTDDRWKIVKEARLCFCCLKPNHHTSVCNQKKDCGENGCNRYHHKLLHGRSKTESDLANANSVKSTQQTPAAGTDGNTDGAAGTIGVAVYIEGTDGPLSIVPLRVKQKSTGGWRTIYGLLDSGATRTLVAEKLANELELDGERTSYAYRTMGGDLKVNRNARKVNFEISGRYRNARFYPISDAVTVKEIGIQPYSINIEEVKKRWPHLQRMKGDNLKNVVPEIVIGTDHGFLMMHHDKLYRSINEPIAVRTVLGWVIQGKVTEGKYLGYNFYVGGADLDDKTHELVKQSFKLDDFGVKPPESQHSVEDKKDLKIMEETTTKSNGRWTTGLLWRNSEHFDAGRREAITRLWQTERRMKKDPNFAVVYSKKIKEYLEKGFIRKLDAEEAEIVTQRTRYIPHFGVTNPNKPGKFRLVFDAASKADGKSLNDLLYTGPDLIRPLTSVLMNFRRHPIILCGDIEDMFHRVYIKEEDRCAQRFFWRDGDMTKEPYTYEMMVMIFGATSSPSSAIFVKNKNALEFQQQYPDAVNAIINDCYIDDLLTGGENADDVIKLRRKITTINSSGGFNMKKFMSNSEEVMKSIPVDLRLESAKSMEEKSLWEIERVLGLWLSPEEDTFTFKLNFHKVNSEVVNGRQPTKREVCSLLPLGFVGHFKIKGMIILQRIWRTGIGWDDAISDDCYRDWQRWLNELKMIVDIKIPRCYSYGIMKSKSIQLHTMVDSSTEAYSAVSYFRIEYEEKVEVSFVASKVKVAPLKKTTIPRLELQAAFLGAKLAQLILSEIKVKIDCCFYWSDSATVLSWIRNETRRFKDYEAARMGYIQEVTNADDWYWVPTADNVADDATRDTPTDLTSGSRWLCGPPFLKLPPELWPVKKTCESVVSVAVADENVLSSDTTEKDESLPTFGNFSSFNRLLRAAAAVGAAAKFWLAKHRKQAGRIPPWNKGVFKYTSNLTPENLAEARVRILKNVQLTFTQMDSSRGKQPQFKNLNVFTDDNGLMRVKGRITRADAREEMKNPVILPGKHHVAQLIVDDEHLRNAHTGKETVFNNIRQQYWITGGRNVVRRSFAKCNFCRIHRAKPVVPEMGDLPSYRLAANLPVFSYTGVDFFGPVEITVGRRHEKRWVALFTCMVTRAVYLDIAAGLSKEDMLHVFSRFVDTFGVPQHMYSDNGTNFVAVEKEVCRSDRTSGMQWHFIPPASPHFGGAWERMVQAVKKVLQNILKDRYPREEVLRTTLKAAENIVNSRPLTYVSSDPSDPESLTPNHFIRGAAICGSWVVCGEDVGDEAEYMRSQYLKAQYYINTFWKRWSAEVLPDLVRRTKWYDTKMPIRGGDVVLLVDDQQPRGTWVKGVITKTFPGSDGITRVVEVTTRHNGRSPTTYKRSVGKVCPLGFNVEDSVADFPQKATKSGAGNVKT